MLRDHLSDWLTQPRPLAPGDRPIMSSTVYLSSSGIVSVRAELEQLTTVERPVVIAGSALFLAIIERFPIVIWGGGALLGWIAGGLLPDDPMVAQYFLAATNEILDVVCGVAGAIFVVMAGWYIVKSRPSESEV